MLHTRALYCTGSCGSTLGGSQIRTCLHVCVCVFAPSSLSHLSASLPPPSTPTVSSSCCSLLLFFLCHSLSLSLARASTLSSLSLKHPLSLDAPRLIYLLPSRSLRFHSTGFLYLGVPGRLWVPFVLTHPRPPRRPGSLYIFSLASPYRLAAAPSLRLQTTKCRWFGQRPFQRSAPSNLASAFLLLTLAVRDQRLPATLGIASSNVIPPATRGRQCRKDATRTGSEAWHVASSKKGKRYHWAQETGVGDPIAAAPRGRQCGGEDPHRTCHQRPAVRGRSA